ncbi:MAG: hypothetical protein PWQ68_1822 [Thermoanaerobacteraceae bacterium]|jgi:hypothetical protein|nr:hypothetical protein [Thermoanaerobacteraceae bacterium]
MYVAELHGKVPSKITRMEDILTSNVFSFFKYSNRIIFLKGYLERLGFKVSDEEAAEAEFIFWPRYEAKTEPDLVLLVGNYYLLIEVKYFSNFGVETENVQAQLNREIKCGKMDAQNYQKDFRLIAITADYIYKKEKFETVSDLSYVIWTNWQQVSSFLNDVLDNCTTLTKYEREFATDLYFLLDQKNLRGFKGFSCLKVSKSEPDSFEYIFFEPKTAKYGGAFLGFENSLSHFEKLKVLKGKIFFSREQCNFLSSLCPYQLSYNGNHIFYKGRNKKYDSETRDYPADRSSI